MREKNIQKFDRRPMKINYYIGDFVQMKERVYYLHESLSNSMKFSYILKGGTLAYIRYCIL